MYLWSVKARAFIVCQQESLSARQTPLRLAVRMKAEKCFSALELNVEIDVQI